MSYVAKPNFAIEELMGGTMGQNVSVTDTILASYSELSLSERQIADFILENHDKVSSFNAYEIAVKSDTSRATMSRFVRKLGFDSFADLRLAFVREERTASGASLESGNDISLSKSKDSLAYILQNKIEELKGTTALLDEKVLKRAISTIEQSDMVLVSAVGNTLAVAQNASYKLYQAGIRSSAPLSVDGSVQLALQLTGRDCLMILSSSGYSKRLEPVMDNANDVGATTIVITDNVDSPLAKRGDIVLQTMTRDALLAKGFHFSQNSLNYMIEILFLFLCHNANDLEEKNRLFWKTARQDREPEECI